MRERSIMAYLKFQFRSDNDTNTSIQDNPTDNGTIVQSISGNTIAVSSGTTDSQLTGAIQSTDGSTQTYTISNATPGTLAAGDTVTVTAEDGTTTATYSVKV